MTIDQTPNPEAASATRSSGTPINERGSGRSAPRVQICDAVVAGCTMPSEAAHDLDWSAVWRGTVSAAAQTLLFWPGALVGHYGVQALRADHGGPRGNTF